jgi:hypothetical protein
MMDNEFTEKEVFNRRSTTLPPSSGPVEEPRGHRDREICQKPFLLQLVMTLMTAGTQMIDGQEQTVNGRGRRT